MSPFFWLYSTFVGVVNSALGYIVGRICFNAVAYGYAIAEFAFNSGAQDCYEVLFYVFIEKMRRNFQYQLLASETIKTDRAKPCRKWLFIYIMTDKVKTAFPALFRYVLHFLICFYCVIDTLPCVGSGGCYLKFVSLSSMFLSDVLQRSVKLSY